MVKGKIYRIIGYTFSIWGVLVFMFTLLKASLNAGFLPAALDILGKSAFNIFLWAGLFLLWRADKIKNPEKKSKWLKVIKLYAILPAVMVAIAIFFAIFPHVLRGRQ